MSDVINIMAEDNRNIIDDDAVPTLTLDNTNASGTGLKVGASGGGTVLDVDATGGIGIDLDGTSGIGIDVNNTTGTGVDILTTSGTALVVEAGALAGQFRSTATASNVVSIGHKTAVSSVTVAPLKVFTSAVSGALIDFGVIDSGAVVSSATSGPTLSARVRVKFGDQYGWINVFESL